MSKSKSPAVQAAAAVPSDAVGLLTDLSQLIEHACQTAAVAVNAGLAFMYWHIGKRLCTEVLGGQRAGYDEEIVVSFSRQLTADYGRGFSTKSLRHTMRFADVSPRLAIVSKLSRQSQVLPRIAHPEPDKE